MLRPLTVLFTIFVVLTVVLSVPGESPATVRPTESARLSPWMDDDDRPPTDGGSDPEVPNESYRPATHAVITDPGAVARGSNAADASPWSWRVFRILRLLAWGGWLR